MMASEKKPESDFAFRLMTLAYKLRDLFQNPRRSLEKARLTKGMSVVDYGCGPGSFTIPAAEMVGHELEKTGLFEITESQGLMILAAPQ